VVQGWSADGETRRWSLEGHSEGVSGLAIRADGRIVSASKDGTLKLWDLPRGEILSTHRCPEPLDSLAVWSGGLAVGDIAGDVWIFDDL
jgi:WD40 repeat protein